MTKPVSRKAAALYAVSVLAQIVIGCISLLSSVPKIRHPFDFLGNVYEYELVGPTLGVVVAATLPWLELVVGVCLLGRILVRPALLAAAAMTAVFIFAKTWALTHDLAISCGCFSASGDVVSVRSALESALLLVVCIAAYLCAFWTASPQAEAGATPEQSA
jgi:uncharacterized membrane protein YphA (DoxX/SURF4 family)